MIHLEIVTPEAIAYTDEVDMVSVPSFDGQLGILPRHIPLFAQLVQGELKIKKGTEEFYLSIGGGFIEVSRKKVTILVTRAVNATQLNEVEILKAKKEAEEALKRPSTAESKHAAQFALRQSLLDLKLINRRKRNLH